MPEFPSNSKSSQPPKPAEKVVEAVVTSEVASRKKSLGRRLREVLIGGDTKSVVAYVIADVLIPQAKDMLAEAVSSGFERLIYGDDRRPGRSKYSGRPTSGATPTNYTTYSARGNNPIGRHNAEDRRPTATVRTQSLDDILFATRVEADAVVGKMYDILNGYESVSVSDLYTLINWSPSYTDQKWGWTDLHGTDVRRVRDGYVLVLPKIINLD
jgi:hypothetical protein